MALHRKLDRDERVSMPLDPETALKALMRTGDPEPDPEREGEREVAKRRKTVQADIERG